MEYRVSVHLEEGTVLRIKADTPEQARAKAKQVLDDYASSAYPLQYIPNPVHRDYMITDIEEVSQ